VLLQLKLIYFDFQILHFKSRVAGISQAKKNREPGSMSIGDVFLALLFCCRCQFIFNIIRCVPSPKQP